MEILEWRAYYSIRPEERTEPVFVDPWRCPGIDSQPGGPVCQHYLSYRPGRLYGPAKSIPGVYTRLQMRALFSSIFDFFNETSRARIFKLLTSRRIDSKEPIPPGCVAWRGGTTTPFLFGS